MRIIKRFVTLTLALFLSLSLFAQENSAKAGEQVPNFSYKTVDGKTYTLKDFAGKYLLVDMWATWCGPCVREIPQLKKLEEKMHGKNIEFVSISVDKDAAKWKSFVESNDMTGVQLHNGGDRTLSTFFDVAFIPRFILIGPDGKVVNPQLDKPSTGDKLVKYLTALPNM